MGNSKDADKENIKKPEDSTDGIVQILSVEQLAYRLNVSVRTIWRLDKNEKIPSSVKVSRRKRWYPEDIDLWLKHDCPCRKKFDKIKERIGNGEKGKD